MQSPKIVKRKKAVYISDRGYEFRAKEEEYIVTETKKKPWNGYMFAMVIPGWWDYG